MYENHHCLFPGAQTSVLTLAGELKGLQLQIRELQQRLDEKDMRIDTLLREAQVMQTQCHEKIKVLSDMRCVDVYLTPPPPPSTWPILGH